MASSEQHRAACSIIKTLLILAFCTRAWSVEFAGGTGDPNDPYQIATADQLLSLSQDPNLCDKHFVLVADIDLDPNLPGRRVFNEAVMEWPITQYRGFSVSTLYGSFDGDGHVIRNCVLVAKEGRHFAGFFGLIGAQGVVRDLHIEDMILIDRTDSTSFRSYAGLLAAVNWGTVTGCSATGTLTIRGGGGLVGQNTGIVAGCRACCDMAGGYVAGLIGFNEGPGRVVLCESDGVVHADSWAGGIALQNTGTFQYCKASGSLSGPTAGGLVTSNRGLLRECYTTATVKSGNGVAYDNNGTIVNCYATGAVSGGPHDGLVVNGYGRIVSSYSTTPSHPSYPPKIQYVYYLDLEKPEGSLIDSPFTRNTIALSSAQMTQRSSFMGFDFYGDAGDGPADHWFMPADGFPVLTWQTEITGLIAVPDVSGLSLEQARAVLELAGLELNGVCYDHARPRTASPHRATPTVDAGTVITIRPAGALQAGTPVTVVLSLGKYDFGQNSGDGSEEKPYRIETAGQLDALYDRSDLQSRHFELVADIDLSGYVYPGSVIGYFNGELNGNGHTIRNLQCGRGMISRLGRDASVHDLVVRDVWVHNMPIDQTNVQVSSAWDIAVLICENWGGQVSRCDVTGRIFGGSSAVGGLVGSNQGPLTDCRFRGRIRPVNESSRVGGLVGTNSGSILRCCVRDVEVLGDDCVGGLVGWNNPAYGPIEACYATGIVQGINFVGGLVGQHGTPSSGGPGGRGLVTSGMIRDCYAACSVTGQQNVGGLIGSDAVEAVQESSFFLDIADAGGPDNGLGTLLTASQMKQQASFTGWDFEKVWMICEGRDYPRLRWEGVQCDE